MVDGAGLLSILQQIRPRRVGKVARGPGPDPRRWLRPVIQWQHLSQSHEEAAGP
jgi:hypothetical protein